MARLDTERVVGLGRFVMLDQPVGIDGLADQVLDQLGHRAPEPGQSGGQPPAGLGRLGGTAVVGFGLGHPAIMARRRHLAEGPGSGPVAQGRAGFSAAAYRPRPSRANPKGISSTSRRLNDRANAAWL